jgi:hypothetical protein
MITQEAAWLATKDTISRTDSAYSHFPTAKNQLMQDVEPGTGTIESAFHAQMDGYSTIKRFVLLFLTNAHPTMQLEIALLATRDMISKKEPVSSQASITLIPLIQDAEHGTGITKSVSPALKDGSSMIRKSAFQFLTNALQVMKMETVWPAIKDTILRMALAFSLNSTMLTPLTQDVEPGTGIIKFASHAPKDGSSMIRKSAYQYLTNAQLMTTKETAWLASRDTTSRKELVSSQALTMLSPLTQDVEHGIGIIKSASLAHSDGHSTLTRFVFPSLTNAKQMMKLETALLATKDMMSRTELVFTQLSMMPSPPIQDVEHGTGITKSA